MAISKSAAAVMLGFGSASSTRSGTATLSSGAASNTLTMPLSQPCQTGYVRVQAKGYTGGGGFASLSIRGTDGTNFWDLGYVTPGAAGTAGDFISLLVPFICDGALTSVTAILALTAATTGGTTAIDGEVWGAPM